MTTIRPAQKSDCQRLDDFVISRAEATPYHLSAWRLAITEAYGHKDLSILAETDGEITGLLPLTLMETPLIGRQLVALPFCDVGGCLAADAATGRSLVDHAIALAARLGAKSLELRGEPPAGALDPTRWQRVAADKVVMLLELPGSAEALWASFKSKLRSQVVKAEKNELTFAWGTLADIPDFYQAWSANMRDLGSPAHARGWFAAVLRHYGEHAHLGLVKHEKKTVAGGIVLQSGQMMSIPWASTRREYNKLNPNMLLYWNLLKLAADSGCRVFDFGRSTMDEGTYKFKAQWGAQPVPLVWRRFPATAPAGEPASGESRGRKLAEQVWQRLPLAVANTIGPILRRHISL